jgi:hypothetical protein
LIVLYPQLALNQRVPGSRRELGSMAAIFWPVVRSVFVIPTNEEMMIARHSVRLKSTATPQRRSARIETDR